MFSWYDMTDYLPGTAGLIEEIDKKHLVVLRDGRTLIGFLRAIDQFANLVLHQTVERIHVDGYYGDIPRGIFVVRGLNFFCNYEFKNYDIFKKKNYENHKLISIQNLSNQNSHNFKFSGKCLKIFFCKSRHFHIFLKIS